MHLHEELRRAREEAGLSQAEVAARAGIPRNQVVRAEKGENITLDTLRKIAIQLPVENLTLLDKLKLNLDFLPQPEKAYVSSMQTIVHLTAALQTALQMAMTARLAMLTARRTEPLPFGEPGGDVDTLLLFKSLESTLQELQAKLQETKIA